MPLICLIEITFYSVLNVQLRILQSYCKTLRPTSTVKIYTDILTQKLKISLLFLIIYGPEESRTPDLFIANEAF